MAFEQTRFSRPLSRFELGLTVALIGIFMGVFVHRVILLTVASEAATLDLMIRNLRTGIMIFVSGKLIEGEYSRIEQLTVSNPFTVMDMPFSNYGGTMTAEELETAARGRWFYDTDNNEVVYKVINNDFFNSAAGTDRVRLKTSLNYDDRNGNGIYESGIDRPLGVSLMVIDDYNWSY